MRKVIPNFSRYEIDEEGNIYNIKTGLKREMQINTNGYWYIRVYNDQDICKTVDTHRLMAITFLKKDDKRLFVNHKDRDRLNCHISNLEWVTPSENVQHAYDMGRVPPRGKQIGLCKLDECKVLTIMTLKEKYNNKEMAPFYGVTPQAINSVRKGRSWGHVTREIL